jgi:hypothetical protein
MDEELGKMLKEVSVVYDCKFCMILKVNSDCLLEPLEPSGNYMYHLL